ncbi:MAG: hypothetical protein OEZ05_08545 [Nitrospirota bacterium]|nr:hypothetical protein [Nitrospirota bacterium]MDH5586662.1 hypothetical protein [Nitrospirota bacterium]
MTNTLSLWEFLSRDVAFLGGPSSPMLSWLGVFGILLFFLWHLRKLKKEVISVQREYERVCLMLGALAQERGDADRDRFRHHPDQEAGIRGNRKVNLTNIRRDCDDLQILDEEMNKEPLFREPWRQYRRTLVLEHVPWFMEPRLFSTRRAEEVLTQEALMGSRINLPFYHQFPSLVTGLGLLLTFLALFIGLGKLHAEGSEIMGIQGLINGLAGKFLTSIVGLMVANLFTFIERPLVARLIHVHHTFLGLVDQLFPRKTMEQMLEQLTSIDGQQQSEHVKSSEVYHPTGGGAGLGLAGPVASLTSSIQSLTALQETAHADTRRTMEDLPGMIRDELHGSLQELTETIHDLTTALKDAPHLARVELPSRSRPLLWKAPPDLSAPSEEPSFGKPKSWPRWPRMSMQRRSG